MVVVRNLTILVPILLDTQALPLCCLLTLRINVRISVCVSLHESTFWDSDTVRRGNDLLTSTQHRKRKSKLLCYCTCLPLAIYIYCNKLTVYFKSILSCFGCSLFLWDVTCTTSVIMHILIFYFLFIYFYTFIKAC